MRPVLVVDEADAENSDLHRHVRQAGFQPLSVAPDAIELDLPACSLVLIGAVARDKSAEAFLASLRQRLPDVPAVVLTGGPPLISSEIALQGEVSGTLPHADVASDLTSTLQAMLGTPPAVESSDPGAVNDRQALSYTIENNPELLPLIVSLARQPLENWPFQDSIDLVRVTVALSEALDNALYHGNLDLDSDLRQGTGQAWRDESRARRHLSPYRDRRIRFQAIVDRQGAEFVIRDEGIGFKLADIGDCTQTENLERCSGRGLLMMKMYMDDVRFNAAGNEIRLKKLRPAEISSFR